MYATTGDRIRVHGRNVGMAEHVGEIVEVCGVEGAPPYRVLFDDEHEALIYPGPECVIEPRHPQDG